VNQRIISTRITQYKKITTISLLLLTSTPLISQPHAINRYRSQELTPHQTTTEQSHLQLLLTDTPEDFRHSHAAKLLHAIDLFHNIPGFSETLTNLVRQTHNSIVPSNGFLYEIETALAMHEQFNEPIIAFGRRHASPRTSRNREIDVDTEHYCIECKSIRWSNLHSDGEKKVKWQLSDEQKIIEEENRRNRSSKTFILFSKQPIPPAWRTWLESEHIAYDCPDDGSDSDSGDQSSQTSDINQELCDT
jgi:hypothetical protein